MIKASALFYTIFISFLISLISGFLIISAYQYNRYIDNAIQFEQIKLNANSGIEYFMESPDILSLNKFTQLDLFDNDASHVEMSYYPWGMYSVISATAKWRHLQFSKTALIGDRIKDEEPIALYLADHNNYLSLCGSTFINGTTYLPKSGVKRAYIEGKSFSGKKLINGNVKEADEKLPEINKDILESNFLRFQDTRSLNDSTFDAEIFLETDSFYNSFSNKTLLVNFDEDVKLSGKTLLGNIIIVSKSKVVISQNNQISNIIVYAPEIEIERNFSGNLQLFATRNITIQSSVDLKYPSNLCLLNNDENQDVLLKIDDATVEGSIVLYNSKSGNLNHSLLQIDKDAVIYGWVYSNDLVQDEGTIYGTLYADKFFLKTPSSIYEDHLLDATIDVSKLSKYFVGANLLEKNEQKEVIKWLP